MIIKVHENKDVMLLLLLLLLLLRLLLLQLPLCCQSEIRTFSLGA